MTTRNLALVAALGVLATASFFLLQRSAPARPPAAIAPPATPPAPAQRPAQAAPPSELAPPIVQAADAPRTPLPSAPRNARRKPWMRGTYGPGTHQFGRHTYDVGPMTPQGFVVTPERQLIVLDTGKKRLLWYADDGKLQRERALSADDFEAPADVAVASDGTLVVMDHLRGTLLFDASGRKKASLRACAEDGVTGLYTVGNQIMATIHGMTTVKVGDTSGSADETTPSLPRQQDGSIHGHVAPDGKTVLSADFIERNQGDFWVKSVRGPAAEQVFRRVFRTPQVSGIPLVQADNAGRVYLVVNTTSTLELICLDGQTGEPVGMVPLPASNGLGGQQFREFSVLPGGGVMHQHAYPSGVTFEVFDCHGA